MPLRVLAPVRDKARDIMNLYIFRLSSVELTPDDGRAHAPACKSADAPLRRLFIHACAGRRPGMVIYMEIRKIELTDETVSRLISLSENWEHEDITWGLRANSAGAFAGMRVLGRTMAASLLAIS